MHNSRLLINGLLAASLIGNAFSIYYIKRTCGTLKIDHSNPEKDVYRFDVDDLDSLAKKKRIVLKVDNNADLSHN